jgi:hypothetical protein
LLSKRSAVTDNLRASPTIFFSPLHQWSNEKASLLFFGCGVTGYATYRGYLLLGSHDNRGGKADSACNIIVGS